MTNRKKCDGKPRIEGENAFVIERGFGKEAEETIALKFHTSVRPTLAELFRKSGLDGKTRDFVDEVEHRVLRRVRNEWQDREEQEAWRAAGYPYPPYLEYFLREWLGLKTSPRWEPSKRARVLATLDNKSWLANATIEDVVSLYSTGLKSQKQRKALHDDRENATQFLRERGLTLELAILALRREAKGKRGPAGNELHFASEGHFAAYCKMIYDNVFRDWLREQKRRRREQATDPHDLAATAQAKFEDGFEPLDDDDIDVDIDEFDREEEDDLPDEDPGFEI